MEAHHINDYLQHRLRNLRIKQSNLLNRYKNYVGVEKDKYRPRYSVPDIDEKVQFLNEKKENDQRFLNQAKMYDAIKNYQDGTISTTTQDSDTRTTAQKMRDEQFIKEAVYKYAYDLLKDAKETSEFIEMLKTKSPDAMIKFVQYFGTIKERLKGTTLLTANILDDFIDKFYEKLDDTSLVDSGGMSVRQFNREMVKYTPPTQDEIKNMHKILKTVKKIDPAKVADLTQRIDAIGQIAANIQQNQAQIQSTLPTQQDIQQILSLSNTIKDTVTASDFLDKTEQLLASVTIQETSRVLNEMHTRMDNLHDDLSDHFKMYTAPTTELLEDLYSKLEETAGLDEDYKNDILDRIDALMQTVNELENKSFTTSTNIPSAEDIKELIESDVISQEAEKKLEAITPEAVEELIAESKDDVPEMTESKSERKQWTKSEEPLTLTKRRKNQAEKKDVKLSTLKDYMDGDKFDTDHLKHTLNVNNITADIIYQTYLDFLVAHDNLLSDPDNEELHKYINIFYKNLMNYTGFKGQARKIDIMHRQITSDIMSDRLKLLGIDIDQLLGESNEDVGESKEDVIVEKES